MSCSYVLFRWGLCWLWMCLAWYNVERLIDGGCTWKVLLMMNERNENVISQITGKKRSTCTSILARSRIEDTQSNLLSLRTQRIEWRIIWSWLTLWPRSLIGRTRAVSAADCPPNTGEWCSHQGNREWEISTHAITSMRLTHRRGLRAKERVTVAQHGNGMRSAVCTALYTATPLA